MFQSAKAAAGHPVKLDSGEVGVRELLKEVYGLWSLDRDLGKVVGEILNFTIKIAGVVAHPTEIFLTGTGIDDEQVFVLSQPVNDHVVHKSSWRIKQRRVLRLSNGETRGVVHRNVLDGGQGLQ